MKVVAEAVSAPSYPGHGLVRLDHVLDDNNLNESEINIPTPSSMILVMGVTGAGKSHFVNTLFQRNMVEVGHTLASCTERCRVVSGKLGGSNAAVVDTPGFDDTRRPNSEILAEIAECLKTQSEHGIKLKGVIYLHRISDERFQGSDSTSLELLQRICGASAFANVVLVTNMWHKIDERKGELREDELCRKYWKPLIQKGAMVRRFDGKVSSATHIIGQLLGGKDVCLELQSELLRKGMSLAQTGAGSTVHVKYWRGDSSGESIQFPERDMRMWSNAAFEKLEKRDRRKNRLISITHFLRALGLIVGFGNVLVELLPGGL